MFCPRANREFCHHGFRSCQAGYTLGDGSRAPAEYIAHFAHDAPLVDSETVGKGVVLRCVHKGFATRAGPRANAPRRAAAEHALRCAATPTLRRWRQGPL